MIRQSVGVSVECFNESHDGNSVLYSAPKTLPLTGDQNQAPEKHK